MCKIKCLLILFAFVVVLSPVSSASESETTDEAYPSKLVPWPHPCKCCVPERGVDIKRDSRGTVDEIEPEDMSPEEF